MDSPSSSSNESHSAQDISFNDSSDESEIDSFDESFLSGYVGEPEYTKEEMKAMKFSSESCSSEESENETNSSRLENLHWCKCRRNKNNFTDLFLTLYGFFR